MFLRNICNIHHDLTVEQHHKSMSNNRILGMTHYQANGSICFAFYQLFDILWDILAIIIHINVFGSTA